MSAISANLTAPPDNFSTTLSSGISSSALTIPLNSVSGLATEGVGVIFTKDANGDVVAGSVEIVHWTGIGGSSLTLTNTGDRGLTGSDAAAQAYSTGAYFEVWVTSYYYKSLRDGIVAADYATAVVAATGKTTPVDADLIGIVDSAASNIIKKLTWANLKATLLTYFNTIYPPVDGWIDDSAETWTYASADSPTFTFTISGDKTAKYFVGQRLKLTQTTVKYFIVTAVSYGAPNTTVTIYGGTDYTLVNAAISLNYHSLMKAPAGFPLNPTKWTVEVTDTSDRTQASPVQNTWYNLGSNSISIPIGIWRVCYSSVVGTDRTSTNSRNDCFLTLSTANNSESDVDFTSSLGGTTGITGTVSSFLNMSLTKEKILSIAAKTPYYLNAKTNVASMSNLYILNGSFNKTIIRAICAYL